MSRHREKVKDIQRYYAQNEEETRVTTHQLEFLITTQILTHYLKPASSILELGAGPGTYTAELAKAGHRVVASDFSETLIAQNRKRLQENGLGDRVRLLVADARDIETQVEKGFDAITVFGPLYHLTKESERNKLLRSCYRLLKPGGQLFTAHITRQGVVAQTLARHPELIVNPNSGLDELWKRGQLKSHPRDGTFRGYFATLDEIPLLVEGAGLEVERLHSQDPCIGAVDEIFNRLPTELKMPWAFFLFQISADMACFGSGRHILCVAKRPNT